MRNKLFYGFFYVLLFLLLSGVVMFLWNLILTQLVHLSKINYWQALGLMVLGRVLFGRFHFDRPFGERGQHHLLKDKLAGMSEADKAAFKEEWRKRGEKR
jgi:hypothetical protein